MIDAAIVGLGWWGRTLVESVQGVSDDIRFVALLSDRSVKARVTLGLGYNRRFHPEMARVRERIRSGSLGTVLHVEATMTFPNALTTSAEAWRSQREETPCGGLTPMGVHAIDGMIDCRAARRRTSAP